MLIRKHLSMYVLARKARKVSQHSCVVISREGKEHLLTGRGRPQRGSGSTWCSKILTRRPKAHYALVHDRPGDAAPLKLRPSFGASYHSTSGTRIPHALPWLINLSSLTRTNPSLPLPMKQRLRPAVARPVWPSFPPWSPSTPPPLPADSPLAPALAA